jgi:hypothetical protein
MCSCRPRGSALNSTTFPKLDSDNQGVPPSSENIRLRWRSASPVNDAAVDNQVDARAKGCRLARQKNGRHCSFREKRLSPRPGPRQPLLPLSPKRTKVRLRSLLYLVWLTPESAVVAALSMSVLAEAEHARSEVLDNPESIYRACEDMKTSPPAQRISNTRCDAR